jgi:lipopolysaccharide transport system ATP-binding protein
MFGQRRDSLRVVDVDEAGRNPETQGGEADRQSPALPDMRNLAIDVSNATMHYPLGSYARGSLKSSLLSIFGRSNREVKPEFVDALRDVNLRISFGERVGLIGHNGSGKSTLLRAMAGIYPLASGRINVVGRIGTLLDVGLGFEPEATGRENIYYRGMTMGYSRRHMARAEAEIVAFSNLGSFIDLPIRTYSAGMLVRLGFAISTQFSPDILLVDEIFGAGDAAFARQAVDRMNAIVKRSGIFVIATHDLGLVEMVCQRVIWLSRGEVVRDGHPRIVIPDYREAMSGDSST